MASVWEASARREQVTREDLVMFINACFTCTGQQEFYSDRNSQRLSIDFLHQYILGNYRLLYARTLAAGVNHFNQAQIILNLLATGCNTPPEHRAEEGALIRAALRGLPPHRAWRLLQSLRQNRVNNRRARAVVRDYLAQRPSPDFEAVKYRTRIRDAVRHAHVKPEGEIGPFLFRGWRTRPYRMEFLEAYRQAHYSMDAVYRLPFTVAEGLAVKHNIPRKVFLARIEGQMSRTEKLRLQQSAVRANGTTPKVDWHRLPLTRLAVYALSLTDKERQAKREVLYAALNSAARRVLNRAPLRLGNLRVAAVLDASYSASGSTEKRRRPLAVALAAHVLLRQASRAYRAFWTVGGQHTVHDPLMVRARGQTDLATPILKALEWQPDLLVIVSDGCENDPPRGASEVLRVFRTKLDGVGGRRVSIVQCNPVFDPEDFTLRAVSPLVPAVGLRDAEDLPTLLGFARLADGSASVEELETHLAARVEQMLKAMSPEAGIENEEKEA